MKVLPDTEKQLNFLKTFAKQFVKETKIGELIKSLWSQSSPNYTISAATNMKASPKEKQKLPGSIKLYSSLSLQVAKAVSFKHLFTFILTCYLQKHRLAESYCKPYFHWIVLAQIVSQFS